MPLAAPPAAVRTSSLVLALALLIGLAHVLGERRTATATSDLGLPLFGVYLNGYDSPLADKAANANAGFATVRVDWSALQSEAAAPLDSGALGQVDGLVAALTERGVTPVGIVGGAPAWAAINPHGPLRPGQDAAFLTFLDQIVGRYKDAPYGVHHWMLWPEPDAVRAPAKWAERGAWGDDPAAFASLLEASYSRVKQIDPSAKIILGPLAHDWFYDPAPGTTSPATGGRSPGFNAGGIFRYSFLDEILKAGAGSAFDALGINAYAAFAAGWESDARKNGRPGVDVAAKIERVRARLARYGVDVPVVIGESGFWSAGGPVPLTDGNGHALWTLTPSPESQAAYVGKLYARARAAGVPAVAWFSFDETGLPDKYALIDDAGNPKPAYAAYRWAATALGTASLKSPQVPLLTPLQGSIESYVFSTGDRAVVVAWATGAETPTARVAVAAGLGARDALGDAVSADVDASGRAVYMLASSPLYFVAE